MDIRNMPEPVEIMVGDQVLLQQDSFSSKGQTISARVIDVRKVLGLQSYVVEMEGGKLKVVGANQISRVKTP